MNHLRNIIISVVLGITLGLIISFLIIDFNYKNIDTNPELIGYYQNIDNLINT